MRYIIVSTLLAGLTGYGHCGALCDDPNILELRQIDGITITCPDRSDTGAISREQAIFERRELYKRERIKAIANRVYTLPAPTTEAPDHPRPPQPTDLTPITQELQRIGDHLIFSPY